MSRWVEMLVIVLRALGAAAIRAVDFFNWPKSHESSGLSEADKEASRSLVLGPPSLLEQMDEFVGAQVAQKHNHRKPGWGVP